MQKSEKNQDLNPIEKRCLILMQRLCRVRETFKGRDDFVGYCLAQMAIAKIKAEMKKNALV